LLDLDAEQFAAAPQTRADMDIDEVKVALGVAGAARRLGSKLSASPALRCQNPGAPRFYNGSAFPKTKADSRAPFIASLGALS
jgi:hypothetical protein